MGRLPRFVEPLMEQTALDLTAQVSTGDARTRPSPLTPLALYALTLFVVVTVVFFIPRAMPGDPLGELFSPDSLSYLTSDEIRGKLAAYYGLDRPIWEQYFSYLSSLAQGDLGWSISRQAPVAELIAAHLPWTLLMVLPSIALATLFSLILGAHSGWVRGTAADRGMLAVFVTVGTVPVFLVGMLLILLFGAQLGWLPVAGAYTAFRQYGSSFEQLVDIGRHLALPVATLTLAMVGRDFLLVRSSMVTVLGEDFILVARAKGLSENALKYRHGLRNALLPVVTRFSMQLGSAVTGAVLVETLFAYPGMGRLMFSAVGARDYPVLEGCFLIAALAVLVANLLADLAYGWLDPRTRRAA